MKEILFLTTLIFLITVYSCNNKRDRNSNQTDIKTVTDAVSIDTIPDTTFYYGKHKISYQSISKETYDSVKKKYDSTEDSLPKITDLNEIKSALKDILIFTDSTDLAHMKHSFDEEEVQSFIKEIHFRNGQTESFYSTDPETFNKLYYPDMYFTAYFPTEDILLLEGGHSSEIAYNLSTGEDIDIVGNPEMTYTSKDKKLRVMGYYTGQESVYFIEVKVNGVDSYQTLYSLKDDFLSNHSIEVINNGFWDKHNLYIRCIAWDELNQKEYNSFYKISFEPYNKPYLTSKEFAIREKLVGNFTIGSTIGDIDGNYKVRHKTIYHEENTPQDAYEVIGLGITLICDQSDIDTDFKDKRIVEIAIRDDRYSTNKQIGTSSSLEEFIDSHPDAHLFYSYIRGMFWVETSELKNILFELNESSFLNNEIDLTSDDLIRISVSDFKRNTRIKSINIR